MAETFTVAATTNRLYLWGMNTEFNTLEKAVLIKPHKESRVDKVNALDNKLEIVYESAGREAGRNSATVARRFSIDNGRLYELVDSSMKLIKFPQPNERVVEMACGSSHVVLRTFSKKIYTFGSGKEGQLGHSNYFAVESPKLLEFQELKNYHALQITASFNSTVLLLSNKKIFWFGSNGTLDRIKTPLQLDVSRKVTPSLLSYSNTRAVTSRCCG